MTDTLQLQQAADEVVSAISNLHSVTASAIAAIVISACRDVVDEGDKDFKTSSEDAYGVFNRALTRAAKREWGDDVPEEVLSLKVQETVRQIGGIGKPSPRDG